MNVLDYVVLISTMVAIAAYGIWKTRHLNDLSSFVRGAGRSRWLGIGLSVMATQASAITFLSTPGQGYTSGLGFVQNYFGAPFALILICIVFLPMYRRMNVHTVYEFIGKRFDSKTRILGACLFLLQRGLSAGITIYAPAIVLSTVLGIPLSVTIAACGLLVVAYTVSGGTDAVSITQKYQMAIITIGMIAAFGVLVSRLHADLGFVDALALAGGFQKLQAVNFSIDLRERYTFWSGLLGGLFLALSYFGADQSQVQRYIGGASLRESRLGLMFNGVCKIPMQFAILLLGVLLSVYYQFETPPVFFNIVAWQQQLAGPGGTELKSLETEYIAAHERARENVHAWLDARRSGDLSSEARALDAARATQAKAEAVRVKTRGIIHRQAPKLSTNDADYVFITFVLAELPHGLIGLLLAAFFAAALQSNAAELNALASTTTIDLYRHVWRSGHDDTHHLVASKWWTVFWGFVAMSFALFASVSENLIQAVNIVGSIFYGVVLGLVLVAFFVKSAKGTAVFWGAITAQALVFVLFFTLNISYLWYNIIGCAACMLFGLAFQNIFGFTAPAVSGVRPGAERCAHCDEEIEGEPAWINALGSDPVNVPPELMIVVEPRISDADSGRGFAPYHPQCAAELFPTLRGRLGDL
jgi:SSS family solute:Na+ symporter